MDKLSSQKVAQVLADTQKVLLSVTAERDKLASDNAVMLRRMEAEKLASAMHDKGVRLELDRDELVGELEKAAEDGRLPVIQEAVDMVAPNMGFTGTLTSDDVAGGGASGLESYILGNVG
jgi:hypothetical protein